MKESTESSPIPPRLVTLCHSASNGSHYHQRVPPECGLLFANREREFTADDAIAIMTHEDTRQWMEGFYYGFRYKKSTVGYRRRQPTNGNSDYPYFLVTAKETHLPSPTEDQDAELFVMCMGHLYRATIEDIYLQCFQLAKFMDCTKCPWHNNERCLTQNFPVRPPVWETPQLQLSLPSMHRDSRDFQEPPADLARVFDKEDWEQKFKPWKSEFAGYLYVPPLSTSINAGTPGVYAIRPPDDHNFNEVEYNQTRLSDRSESGVKTRQTLHYQCRRCYFGGEGYKHIRATPCTKYNPRSCEHGAWTEEEVCAWSLKILDSACTETPWTRQSVWQVANIAGIEFQKINAQTGRPQKWVVSYMHTTCRSTSTPCIEVTVKRVSRSVRGEHEMVSSPATLREFLSPFLRDAFDHAATKPIDEKQLALWAQLASLTRGKGYSYFYSSDRSCGYMNVQPAVGFVELSSHGGVDVQLWLSRQERYVRFANFKEVQEYYNELPLFSVRDAELRPRGAYWSPRWLR